jgi:PucR C-terminal helix-turn-helix domain
MLGPLPGSKAAALIRQWGGRFRKDPLAAAVVAGLKQRSGEIWQGTFRLLQQESPEYRNSVDDEQRLGVHTNTVYFRLNRVKKLTGVDARTYSGTSLLLTALRLSEIHGAAGPG